MGGPRGPPTRLHGLPIFGEMALRANFRRGYARLRVLAAPFLILLFISGCATVPPAPGTASATPGAQSGPTTPANATKAPSGPTAVPTLTGEHTLSLATSGTDESYYGYGKALSALWSGSLSNVRVVPSTAGASVAALRSIGANQVDMALAQSDIADYAYNGTQMFGDKIGNLRSVAVLFPQLVQWVMDPDIIYTIQGIKGAQIAVGPAGSGSEANTREILDANGIAYKDLVKALFLTSNEAVTAFNTGQIHGFCLTDAISSPAVVEATNTRKIRMLPITGSEAQNVMSRYKRLAPATIPAGSYKGVSEAVPTLGVRAILVVRQGLDDSLVYWLTRTLMEKQAELAQANPLGKELAKSVVQGDLPVPLHPGAERYYRETGTLK